MPTSLRFCCLLALLLPAACKDATPLQGEIFRYCESQSGLSRYFIKLAPDLSTGQLRYQYFGQDLAYSASNVVSNGNFIRGRADFANSATGETRGNSFDFELDVETGEFSDGATNYSCELLQDRRLIDLPGEM